MRIRDKKRSLIVERIWLQGKNVLVPLFPLARDSVSYRIPGLDGELKITDYRTVGRAALKAAATEAGAASFHENFDSPALVTILEDGRHATVELRELASDSAPVYDVLWIATMVDQSLPAWPKAWHMESLPQGGRRSFVAILE